MMHSPYTTAVHNQKLQRARQQFFERGELPQDLVSSVILRSWQRCQRLGLDSGSYVPQLDSIDLAALSAEKERNQQLLQHGRSIFGHLHDQLRDSASMALLADANGLVLDAFGDTDFVERAKQIALVPGALWDERSCGTNAIGTALAEEALTQVVGGEHYFAHNQFLACCASPVFGANGELLGVFNISGEHLGGEKHAQALVSLSAAMIERRLFESAHGRDLLVCFQRSGDGLVGVSDGLAAISADGEVLSINRAGLKILGIRRSAAVSRSFAMVFESDLATLIDKLRNDPLGSAELSVNGTKIDVQLRGQLPVPLFARNLHTEPTRSAAPRVPEAEIKPACTLDSLNSGDQRLQLAIDRAKRILGRDIPLLIQGESGVGKELFAKGFHHSGPRSGKPFVALNCASIPESLIESELFGYQGGAFTGARKDGAPGKILQAHGGTLFLDEIGDMPLALQARLLRVLQERCVTPLGSTQTIPVDISLVCATHRRLNEEVARGNFREDLYYRLNSLCVTLPALRERSDIRELVAKLASAEAGPDREISFSTNAMQALENYRWPGNIRQLFNVVRVAVTLLDAGESEVTTEQLPEELFDHHDASAPTAQIFTVDRWTAAAPDNVDSLDQIERLAAQRAVNAAGGNISAAARKLGVSRNTLYRILGKGKEAVEDLLRKRAG